MEVIGDYMTPSVRSVDSSATVQEAAKLMHAQGVGSLLVKDNGKYVGILTDSGLARRVVGEAMDARTTRVSEVMSKTLLTLDRGHSVEEANEFMRQHQSRHLIVTDQDQIIGVLSVKDLVAYFVKWHRVEEG